MSNFCQESLSINPVRYRRLVGKHNYLIVTRPTIVLDSPYETHWDATVCIIQYIKGLLYEDRGHEKIRGYTDVIEQGSLLKDILPLDNVL